MFPSQDAKKKRVGELVPHSPPDEVWTLHLSGRRVLVLMEPPEEMTDGGLFIPETSQHNAAAGWAINVGAEVGGEMTGDRTGLGVLCAELNINVWDLIGLKILFGDYTGQHIKFTKAPRNQKYKLYQEHEIWGVIGDYDA